ncbi:MAG: OmpA-OmpF porin, family, partial [Acidobacteriota bacterium]
MLLKRVAMVVAVALGCAATASAQTSTAGSGQAAPQSSSPATPGAQQAPARVGSDTETRPATTTFEGDTGLWFVPTGEVLPAKRWSLSAYRVNFDRDQGFTDVSNWPVTGGIGIANHLELFGAFTVVRRIDRDVRAIFVPTQ